MITTETKPQKRSLELFKKAIIDKLKFYADDFAWGYRVVDDKYRIFWALLLRNNVYADCMDCLKGEKEEFSKAIKVLEHQAVETHEGLATTIKYPGRLIDVMDSDGKMEFNVPAYVKRGDVHDLHAKLSELFPDAVLFDSKEDLLDNLNRI
jgi:hypothetical protein